MDYSASTTSAFYDQKIVLKIHEQICSNKSSQLYKDKYFI